MPLLAFALACSSEPIPDADDDSPIELANDPEQSAPLSEPIEFERGDWHWKVIPRAAYTLRGLVLGRERYRSGWNSIVSPCDLALAWGPMTDRSLLERIDFSQAGRWYEWRYGADFPEDNQFVARFSANVHILPANDNIAAAACSVSAGEPVELVGMLVDLRATQGARWMNWNSSLSRTDRGDGSCEVMWVESLRYRGKIYR